MQERIATQLRSALQLDLPYADHEERASLKKNAIPNPAAVLILIGYQKTSPAILYTRRTDTVETHKGQISFPGGQCDPHELTDTRLTALRETEEEMGIPSQHVQILGRLPTLLTVTHFQIDPWIGLLTSDISDVPMQLNASEIADANWITLDHLQTAYTRESIEYLGRQVPIHVYTAGGYRIWGATGIMTHNLLSRFEKLKLF